MAMTRLERGTRYAIAKFLNQQGYPRYADIFMKYELHFHNPRRPFAAMVDTDKGIIYINPTIDDKETLSVLIRHEILHIYLAHQKRILQHFAKQKGLKWTEFDDIPLEALMNMSDEEINTLGDAIKQDVITDRQVAKDLYSRHYKGVPYHNYVADLEIDNRGYTDSDKNIIRNLVIGGISFKGLLIDDNEPEWVGMSVEEMMDAVEKHIKKEEEELKQDLADGIIRGKFDPKTGRFTDRKGVVYGKA